MNPQGIVEYQFFQKLQVLFEESRSQSKRHVFASYPCYSQALMTVPFLSWIQVLCSSSQHSVLTHGKAVSLLMHLGFTRAPQHINHMGDALPVPWDPLSTRLAPHGQFPNHMWADRTRALFAFPGNGHAVTDLFLGAAVIHYWGGERHPASSLRALASGPTGSSLCSHGYPEVRSSSATSSAAVRARGLFLCLTDRSTAAMQCSSEPCHAGSEKPLVILPS